MSFGARDCVLPDIDAAIHSGGGSSPIQEIRMSAFHSLAHPCRKLCLAIAVLAALPVVDASAATPKPVLLVIANQDFHYAEYAAVRASLEARGLPVVVAAGETRLAFPQGRGAGMPVQPMRALASISANDHSAVVFVGGWGASSYQYAFSGTYENASYRSRRAIGNDVNRVIGEFVAADKPVAGVCHGVSVLAWARVDGVSPLQGRTVVASPGGTPAFRFEGVDYPDAELPIRMQIELNGARMLTSGSIGNPLTSSDDVIVDGRIITAEDYRSANRFAELLAQSVASTRN
jgi:putative intracellular protease/amidase